MFKHSFFTLSLFILQILSAGVIQALGASNVLRGRTSKYAKVPASNKVGGGGYDDSSASPPCQNISLCPIVQQRDVSKGNAALENILNDVGNMDERSLKRRKTHQKDMKPENKKPDDKKPQHDCLFYQKKPDDKKPMDLKPNDMKLIDMGPDLTKPKEKNPQHKKINKAIKNPSNLLPQRSS